MSRQHYVAITQQVLADGRLTLTEKVVAARILGFGNKQYFETAPTCAKFLGISEKSVQRARARLEELGIIKLVSFDGRKNTYEIIIKNFIQIKPKFDSEMSSQRDENVRPDRTQCPVPTGAYNKTILKLKENYDENYGAPLPAETAGAPDHKYNGGYVDDDHLKFYKYHIFHKGVSFEDWKLAQ